MFDQNAMHNFAVDLTNPLKTVSVLHKQFIIIINVSPA